MTDIDGIRPVCQLLVEKHLHELNEDGKERDVDRKLVILCNNPSVNVDLYLDMSQLLVGNGRKPDFAKNPICNMAVSTMLAALKNDPSSTLIESFWKTVSKIIQDKDTWEVENLREECENKLGKRNAYTVYTTFLSKFFLITAGSLSIDVDQARLSLREITDEQRKEFGISNICALHCSIKLIQTFEIDGMRKEASRELDKLLLEYREASCLKDIAALRNRLSSNCSKCEEQLHDFEVEWSKVWFGLSPKGRFKWHTHRHGRRMMATFVFLNADEEPAKDWERIGNWVEYDNFKYGLHVMTKDDCEQTLECPMKLFKGLVAIAGKRISVFVFYRARRTMLLNQQ